MAMNVQGDGGQDEAELNTTINTTPLVDVMLVLLIIFLVTIPVIVKTVPVELPNERNIATQTKPENIVVSVDRDENVYYNNRPIEVGELRDRFVDAIRRAQARGVSAANMPEVHIRGDRNVRFAAVGRVIFAAQQAGILKVGFITEPRNQS
ncbi:MAG: biopolymer transporter ExbD [Alphaproteobacteria bacterium]|nr:biopolymer transporter ExbD [Alphaproteobacteria bacterium]MBV9694068.1 biopolymer transporter ExbD [Alphaproteobacteria bacterium]